MWLSRDVEGEHDEPVAGRSAWIPFRIVILPIVTRPAASAELWTVVEYADYP